MLPVASATGYQFISVLGPAAADLTSAPVPVSWHEAMGGKGTHVVGVEAGTAALADAERLLTLDHRTWQRIEDTLLDTDAGLLADPGNGSAPVGAFSRSGWGDGGYGVYWGLAEDGAPLHLVIDFGLIWAPAPAPEQ